jgi:hypothetical protein
MEVRLFYSMASYVGALCFVIAEGEKSFNLLESCLSG